MDKKNQENIKEQVSEDPEGGEQDPDFQPQPQSGQDSEDSDEKSDDDSVEDSNQPVQKGEPQESHSDQSPQPKPSNTNNNIDLKTVEALEDSLKDLTDTNQTRETFYFELPKLRLDRVIVPNSEIHDQCELSWSPEADVEYRARMEKYGVTSLPKDRFAYADQEYVKFKREFTKRS